ncbi:single-stranded DNA-binding protein [uncultured Staphylococcus sp.]|uniref:single-stranded DNA-binding protein n=1 Tax=uncultured Staphylococcus sp. TaxID=189668 RepID=UPI0025E2A609|nr:single-stranded DNA-binding protein [uncultured Staphylococcus sp.]
MNNVNLIGNLVADPKLKGKENNVASFRVAVQRPFKNKQTDEYETDFINCVSFGKTAEIITKYFSKGQKIGVTGSIQTGSYENKEGKRVFITNIAVSQVTFIERKTSSQNTQPPQVNNQSQSNPFNNVDTYDINQDDLPF